MLVKAAGAMCPGPQPRFAPADYFRVQAVMFAHLADLDRLIASEGLNVYLQPLGGSRATLDNLKPLSMVFVGYGETANVLNRGHSAARNSKSRSGAFLPSRALATQEFAGRLSARIVAHDGYSQTDLSGEPTRGP
jgi:hypothetical protein